MGPASASLALLTVVLWGGTAVSNSFALDVLPTIYVGGARFGLASLFMVVWCLVERSSLKLNGPQFLWAALLGVLLFAQIGLFNVGTAWSSSSNASILVNSYIFWVAAIEHFVTRHIRLHWWQLLGLLVATAGCGVLLLDTAQGPVSAGLDQTSLEGDLVMVLSGFVLGVKVILTKYAVRHVRPGPLIFWHDVVGTALFFAASFLAGERIQGEMTPSAWIAVLYGGLVVSGFCFGANAWLLKRHGASQVSVFSFATPICGVALGVLLRGDRASPWLVVAAASVTVGIYLVNRTSSPFERPEVDAGV